MKIIFFSFPNVYVTRYKIITHHHHHNIFFPRSYWYPQFNMKIPSCFFPLKWKLQSILVIILFVSKTWGTAQQLCKVSASKWIQKFHFCAATHEHITVATKVRDKKIIIAFMHSLVSWISLPSTWFGIQVFHYNHVTSVYFI